MRSPIQFQKAAAGTQVFDVNDTLAMTQTEMKALTYSIVGGNNAGLFAIDQARYELVNQQLILMHQPQRRGARSDYSSYRWDYPVEAKITVRVANVNDNNPQLQNQRAKLFQKIQPQKRPYLMSTTHQVGYRS